MDIIALGLRTTDPAASYRIVPEDGQDIFLASNKEQRFGNYTAVYTKVLNSEGKDLEDVDQVRVLVTAADGKTEQTHILRFVRASSETGLTSLTVKGATLDEAFDQKTANYYLELAALEDDVSVTASLPAGATMTIDGQPVADGAEYPLDPALALHKIVVTAEDAYTAKTYYLVTRINGQEIPYFGISEDTQALASKMLVGWKKNVNSQRVKKFGNYWQIFMAEAAEPGFNFNGSQVYDVSKHPMNQTTDYAACILQLVILGQNPYDFDDPNTEAVEHRNFVEEMMEEGGGPWACNIWYVMAAKAAGIPVAQEGLDYQAILEVNAVKESYDLDMRAWAIAALHGLVSDKDMAAYIDRLHSKQQAAGNFKSLFTYDGVTTDIANIYTNGCVLSAIASGNVDIERQFALDGATPLTTIQKELLRSDGKFISVVGQDMQTIPSYAKDMVIGLGDIAAGSNLWDRYALTYGKAAALVDRAETLAVDQTKGTAEQRQAVREAAAAVTLPDGYAAQAIVNDKTLGQAYYTLYEAMSRIDTAMKPQVQFGLTADEKPSGGGSSSSGSGSKQISVSFRLIGDTQHHTAAQHSRYVTWIKTGVYQVPENSTVYDVFKKALKQAGIRYTNKGNYISAIQNPITGKMLEEFSNGSNSGWMYTLNGTHPKYGVEELAVKDGDEIVFHYVDDYTTEEDAFTWLEAANVDPTKEEAPVTDPEDSNPIRKDLTNGSVTIKASELAKATSLTINGSITLTLDKAALKEIGASGDLRVEVKQITGAKLAADSLALIGSRPVYEVTLTSNQKRITQFKSGKLDIVIPYTPTSGENNAKLFGYYINAEGKAERIAGSSYVSGQKGVVLEANRLPAYFAVGYDENAAVVSFSDVPSSHWAAEYIHTLAAKGLLNGKTETTFGPNDSITRAEFAAILCRMSGDALPAASSQFTDVEAGAWYAQNVAWAVKTGIAKGVTENAFEPNVGISREEMAVMLSRYAAYKKVILPVVNVSESFTDEAGISSWAMEAVKDMRQAGIVGGKENNTFAPQDKATRAEAAKMLYLIIK